MPRYVTQDEMQVVRKCLLDLKKDMVRLNETVKLLLYSQRDVLRAEGVDTSDIDQLLAERTGGNG